MNLTIKKYEHLPHYGYCLSFTDKGDLYGDNMDRDILDKIALMLIDAREQFDCTSIGYHLRFKNEQDRNSCLTWLMLKWI